MAARRIKPGLCWVVDSREQNPFTLAAPDPRSFTDCGTITDSIDAGDYTADAETTDGMYRLPIRIERKSHIDYCSVIGQERERFEAELSRLAAYRSSHVVVEVPLAAIRAGHMRSRICGDAAFLSAPCWTIRFGVHFWFCTNRNEAQILVRALLQEAAKHYLVGDAIGQ